MSHQRRRHVTVNATGTVAAPGDTVHMNMVIADTKAGFNVDPTAANDYSYTFHNIPAGTYFVRNEYTDDKGDAGRSLKINSFDVTGASIISDNTTTAANLNTDALAAADSYIANYRRGDAHLMLTGATPGSSVHVKLTQHAFNFGVNVPGSDAATQATYLGTPTPGSNSANFQSFLKTHYINTLVPSNYGKWANTEATQNVPTMGNVDSLVAFAQANDMRVRMHAMIWGAKPELGPEWCGRHSWNRRFSPGDADVGRRWRESQRRISPRSTTGLITTSAQARPPIARRTTSKWTCITRKSTSADRRATGRRRRCRHFQSRPRSSRTGRRQHSAVRKRIQRPAELAVKVRFLCRRQAGVEPYPYVGVDTGSDQYANWYRQNIDDIQTAAINKGYGPVISGVGSQYYAIPTANNTAPPAASTVAKALENLSVTGLPMSLTEFGIQAASATVQTNQAVAADTMEQAMRMVFGNPDADTFMYWGFWAGATSNLQSGGTLVGTAQPNGTAINSAWKKGRWLVESDASRNALRMALRHQPGCHQRRGEQQRFAMDDRRHAPSGCRWHGRSHWLLWRLQRDGRRQDGSAELAQRHVGLFLDDAGWRLQQRRRGERRRLYGLARHARIEHRSPRRRQRRRHD